MCRHLRRGQVSDQAAIQRAIENGTYYRFRNKATECVGQECDSLETKNLSETLKPCPFCGAEIDSTLRLPHSKHKPDCYLLSDYNETHWNTRVPDVVMLEDLLKVSKNLNVPQIQEVIEEMICTGETPSFIISLRGKESETER